MTAALLPVMKLFSLTPVFRPVTWQEMDISRFNGLRFASNVCPFLLSLLDSLDLGNLKSRETAE